MKTTNFKLQRRRHFIKIMMILCLELIIFGVWTFNMLSPENISVSEKMGHIICTFMGVCIVNGFWLYFIEDRLFFNKYAIMNKMYRQKIATQERIDYLNKTLGIISKDGKPIHTAKAMETWETLPMYCSHKFDHIIEVLNKELNVLYDKLNHTEKKELFFFGVHRENLWMYFKGKERAKKSYSY
ncbi:MAG: hypothetical protein WCO66_05090 [Candidatus Absconditabacteria bacterium]